jgi:hypothetical protein
MHRKTLATLRKTLDIVIRGRHARKDGAVDHWGRTCLKIASILFSALCTTPAVAQHLCENSDTAVASISPCTGPTGTRIAIKLRKTMPAPALLQFTRGLTYDAASAVSAPVTDFHASSPPQLCASGGGKWEVWLVDAKGTWQGVIGAFWPDCRRKGPSSPSITRNASPAKGPQHFVREQ